MRKKLSLFLIVSFLCVQMLSLLHMAGHGFAKHKHDGRVCSIYKHDKHTNYSVANNDIVIPQPESYEFQLAIFPNIADVQHVTPNTKFPRAPPLTL